MMFYDPYSERQGLYRFLSENKVLICIAAVLLFIVGMELASLYHRIRGGAGDVANDGAAAQAAGENVGENAASHGRDGALDAGSGQAAGTQAAWVDDAQAPGKPDGDWRLVLINNNHPMPEAYAVSLASLRNGLQVDERIREPLEQMIADAGSAGLSVLVASAYRTAAKQTELYENKVERLRAQGMEENQAKAEAIREVAFPGNSEHQLGLAVDLVASHYQRLDDGQADTAENQWLQARCRDYGFILRYPQDKTDITGVIYESWHFRYVGVEAAGEIMDKGLCLEEYIDLLNGK